MAQTKDWGPEFARVADLFQKKSTAYQEHEQAAQAEIDAHDGSHAYGRHGYQTGWESQLVRAVTGISPDQTFDPRGVNPEITRWNFQPLTYSGYGRDGQTTEGNLFDETFIPSAGDYETKAGTIAGGFATPEAQRKARNKADEVAASLSGPNTAGVIWRFTKPKAGTINNPFAAPLTSIKVLVSSSRDGDPYGIGFAQRDPKSYRKESRETVLRCLDGFFNRKTWAEIFPDLGAGTRKFHQIALKKKQVAFPQVTDLFEFFDLDVLWQKSATVIFRRIYTQATKSFSAWRMVTMFPDNLAPGWAPSLFLPPEWKTKLKNDWKMNANADDYVWTGQTCDVQKKNKATHPIPTWA